MPQKTTGRTRMGISIVMRGLSDGMKRKDWVPMKNNLAWKPKKTGHAGGHVPLCYTILVVANMTSAVFFRRFSNWKKQASRAKKYSSTNR